MRSSLRLKSSYVEKKALFRGPRRPKEVSVWVESDDDVRFWKRILKDTDQFQFSIIPFRNYKNGTASDGCSGIISSIANKNLELGKYLIACIDSDYRFLIKEESTKFLFETKIHSKESVFLFNDCIDDAVTQSTNINYDKNQNSSKNLLNAISKIIMKPFVLFIFLMSENISNEEITKFPSFVRDYLLEISKQNFYNVEDLKKIQIFKDFHEKMNEKATTFMDEVNKNSIKDKYESFKIDKKDYFSIEKIHLFFRGHDIFDFIVNVYNNKCENLLYCEKESINKSKITPGEKRRRIGQLFNARVSYKTCLELSSIDFSKIPFFSETIIDINNTYNI